MLAARATHLNDGDEVPAEVVAVEVLLPQNILRRAKVLVEPQPVVRLVFIPLPLDHQSDRALVRTLRRVRDARRQQEDVALADVDDLAHAGMHNW